MQVQDLMTKSIECILPDASVTEAARIMRDFNVGMLPVTEDGVLLGIITDRDICCRCVAEDCDPDVETVSEIMTTDVLTCFNDQDILDAAHLMENMHIRRLTVMDHNNHVMGVLSVDDLAKGSHNLAGEVLAAVAPLH